MNARRRVRASFRRSLAALNAPARVFRLGFRRSQRSPQPLARRILEVARREAPNDAERQRDLDGVLAALRQLTSGVA